MFCKKLINIGIEHIKAGDFKSLLYGIAYFSVSTKNFYLDRFRYLLVNLRFRHLVYVETLVNGSYLMYINLKDKGISQELFLHKKREHFSTDFMKEVIDDDEIIIDVGANIGYYALLESQMAPNGCVYALEPIPSNMNLLKKNVELNAPKNIQLFQYAMGDLNHVDKMFVYDKCNWCSFNKNLDTTLVDEVEVRVITLTKFIECYVHLDPTFVRMDTEGYEYQIIKGASELFKQIKHLKLCVELHPHLMSSSNMAELIDIFKQCDFNIQGIFLDPEPHNYQDVKLLNMLNRKLNRLEYGFLGSDYETLNQILKTGKSPIVYLKKS